MGAQAAFPGRQSGARHGDKLLASGRRGADRRPGVLQLCAVPAIHPARLRRYQSRFHVRQPRRRFPGIGRRGYAGVPRSDARAAADRGHAGIPRAFFSDRHGRGQRVQRADQYAENLPGYRGDRRRVPGHVRPGNQRPGLYRRSVGGRADAGGRLGSRQ